MAGLGLVHSLYRAHRTVVPATAWHLVYIQRGPKRFSQGSVATRLKCTGGVFGGGFIANFSESVPVKFFFKSRKTSIKRRVPNNRRVSNNTGVLRHVF